MHHPHDWGNKQIRFPLLVSSLILTLLATPSYSQIRVIAPVSLANQVQATLPADSPSVIPGTTATFGAPSYDESFIGHVISTQSNSSYCAKDYSLEDAIKALPHDGLRHIVLLERGGCTFVKKVSIAESLGAEAVIMMDSQKSNWTREKLASVIVADDGHGSRVRIPSLLITRSDGMLFSEALKAKEDVIVQLDWSIPQKAVVTVDYWTDSGSSTGMHFLKEYAPHAKKLEHRLKFTPHYNVYGLPAANKSNTLCLPGDGPSLCADPPDVGGTTVTGRDVLREDLRQLCLLLSSATINGGVEGSMYSPIWWDYVARVTQECPVVGEYKGPLGTTRFGEDCSFKLMAELKADVDRVKKCVAEQGQDLLAQQKEDKAWSVLALRINGYKFHGSLEPVSVSRAVCSAFESAPDVCPVLTGRSTPPAKVVVQTDTSSTVRSIMTALLVLACLSAVGLYLYQRHIKKTMRASLRHEVMMEVRSQLQEYHQFEDDVNFSGLGGTGGKRLIEGSSIMMTSRQ